MNITIIGTGNMARGLGSRLVASGKNVTVVSRETEKAEALAAQLQAVATNGTTASGGNSDTIDGEIVVLAIPYLSAAPFVQQHSHQLGGKIIVDMTNPIDFNTMELAVAPGSSAAEEIAAVAPAGTTVVKAFNTIFAGTLATGEVAGHALDVYIAGDDEAAKTTLAQVLRDSGLNPIDVGKLARSQQLEGLALLGITLQFTLNTGFQTAWKLLTPQQD